MRSVGRRLTSAAMVALLLASGLPPAGVLALTAVTVDFTASSRPYDGTLGATITGCTLTGVVEPDEVTCDFATATATFADTLVGNGKTVTGLGFDLAGANAADYEIVTINTTLADISALAITVTAVADTRPWDGTTASAGVPTVTSGALAAGDTGTWSQTFDTAAVGTGKTLTPTGTVTNGSAADVSASYDITFALDTTGAITGGITQTITFGALGGKTYGNAAFTVSASASSGLTVTFSSTTLAVCTVAGTTVTIGAAGTCTIQADQAGDVTFLAAEPVLEGFTVAKATLAVTAGNKGITYGSADPTFTFAYGTFVGSDDTLSIDTPPTCGVTGAHTDVAGSPYTIACSGGLDDSYSFSYASGTLTVAQATPTISVTGGSFPYTGSSHAGSGFAYGVGGTADVLTPAVTLSYSGTGGTTYGPSPTAPTAVGSYSVTAAFSGNANYAATSASTALTIGLASQAITFGALGGKTYGAGAFTVSATASSGLTVTFSSTTLAVCTVAGTTVTIVAAGDCTIQAGQAGDSGYAAAPAVAQAFTIAKATPTIGLAGVPAGGAGVYEANVPATFTATLGPTVGGTMPGGAATFSVDGVARPPVAIAGGVATLPNVTFATTGAHQVSVTYAGDGANFGPAPDAALGVPVVANTVRASGVGVSSTLFYPVVDTYRDTVSIRGSRAEPLAVVIRIYDARGRQVRSASLSRVDGAYAWTWNGRNASRRLVAAGRYRVDQVLTDAYGASQLFRSYVSVSPRRMTWTTITRYVLAGPRCYQFAVRDGSISAYACSTRKALVVAGTAGQWPAVGYQFSLPRATTYKNAKVQVLGTWSGIRPTLGLQTWSRGAAWGQLFQPWFARTAISPTAATWRGLSVANPSPFISSKRLLRVYVDGGGRLAGSFRLALTRVRLTITYGILR